MLSPHHVACAASLLLHVQADVAEAQESLEQACRHGLSHGKLLCLRYLIPDIPWHTLQSTAQAAERLRAWAHRLVGLALRAAQSALPPLSTPQETGLGVQRSMHHRKLLTTHLLLYSCLVRQRVDGCWSSFGCVYVLLARRSQNVS